MPPPLRSRGMTGSLRKGVPIPRGADALEQDEDGAIQSCLSSPKDRRFASGPGQNTVIRSEHNDLAYGGDVGEAIKPRVDVVKPDRAAFEPVDG
jgi:hypothetical protein